MASSPAFQFYPSDFLADENQMLMELAEAGAYIRLICVCWKEGSIPTDLRKLAKLVGATPKEMANIWPALAPCFDPHPVIAERLVHPRLEKERRKQNQYHEKMSQAGKKGAERRHSKGTPEPELAPSQAIAKPQPGLSSGIALQFSSSSSASAESSETDKPQRVAVVEKSGGDAVGNSRFELLEHAKRECGMGTWKHKEIGRAASVIEGWARERKKTAAEIFEAIHGARLMVDRNKVDWRDEAGRRTMLPGKPFGLYALVNTTTLFDQGDGRAPRPFFDCAIEEYRRADTTGPPPRTANTGPERIRVAVNAPNPGESRT